MSDKSSPAVEGYTARWLAESLRLHESQQPVADLAVVSRLAVLPGDAEQKILARASALDASQTLALEQKAQLGRERLALLALALLAIASGFVLAVGVLGDGRRAVNVIWALGGLLGVHALSFLVWMLIISRSGGRGGIVGRAWEWLVSRLTRNGTARVVWLARVRLDTRAGAQPWMLGAVSHWGWTGLFVGVLLGLLVSFSLRRYGFVWETTILPVGVFEALVSALAWLPSLIGFPVPDAELILASGEAMQVDAVSAQTWSLWLIACVLCYGLVPRLLAWGLCQAKLRQCRARLRLYPGDAAYTSLVERLMRPSQRMGVADAAPAQIETAHLASPHQAAGQSLLVGVELDPARVPWPPALSPGVGDAGVVDSREQRRRVMSQVEASKPRRLLIACDPRLSPDRGSLSLIADLSVHAGECAVWLVEAMHVTDTDRLQHWLDALAQLGLGDDHVFQDMQVAMTWVESL